MRLPFVSSSITLMYIKDFPLCTWIPEIDRYVSELLRLEGRGNFTQGQAACKNCIKNDMQSFYRCIDCHDIWLLCQDCLVKMHAGNPLHRVQVCIVASS